jgi:hypothetical protein
MLNYLITRQKLIRSIEMQVKLNSCDNCDKCKVCTVKTYFLDSFADTKMRIVSATLDELARLTVDMSYLLAGHCQFYKRLK